MSRKIVLVAVLSMAGGDGMVAKRAGLLVSSIMNDARGRRKQGRKGREAGCLRSIGQTDDQQ